MKTERLIARFAIGATLIASNSSASAGDIFNFAGFTFDQRNSPNRAVRLGNNANLGGAQFSSGFATTTTGIINNFPQGGTGFDTALSLAQLTGLGSGLRAVNLPNGNDGIHLALGTKFCDFGVDRCCRISHLERIQIAGED